MMRIIPRGADTYLFRDGSHSPVGWLRGRTVRFTRFAARRDAVAAAVQGGLALAAYAGGTTLYTPHAGPQVARPPDDVHDLAARGAGRTGVRVAHDGRYEWVFVDGTRVARLVPPADVAVVPMIEDAHACGGSARALPSEAGAFSLEFLLAERVSFDACLTLARMLFAAVHHHQGRSAPAPDATPVRAPTRGSRGRRGDGASGSDDEPLRLLVTTAADVPVPALARRHVR